MDVLAVQVSNLVENLNMKSADTNQMIQTLSNTVFKDAKPDELATLLIVANQYKLNPFTKEIYAFPSSRGGGIIPVVSVDGWSRIINDNPLLDGVQFEQTDTFCTCKIYRKDRSHPTVVTEYLKECYREKSDAWQKYPMRMLRHKSLIQCARVAFGFSGIYDEDEAKRIEQGADYVQPLKDVEPVVVDNRPYFTDELFNQALDAIDSGKRTKEQIANSTHYRLTEAQEKILAGL